MFEESKMIMGLVLLLISFQGALGLMGAVLVYDRIRNRKPG